MGFKVGDKVRVKSWKEIRKMLDKRSFYRGAYFSDEMKRLCGKVITLCECYNGVYDFMNVPSGKVLDWCWIEEWLEPIESVKKKEKEPVKMEKVVVVRGMNEQQIRKYLGALPKSIETVEMPRSVKAICQEILNKRKDPYYHYYGNATIAVDYTGKHIGIARCHPNDKMNLEIALALSKARAFGWKALEKELLAAL